MKKTSVVCKISKKTVPQSKAKPGFSIRASILDIIKEKFPDFNEEEDSVSDDELNKLRVEHVKRLFEKDKGKITEIEQQVAESIIKHDFMSSDFTIEDENPLTFGEKIADRIAEFGGSWRFIISFGGFLFLWIIINAILLSSKGFDPYPFILLNLILSTIAALQAPVIMMSQNRMEAKDRQRNMTEFKVNLKAELEIRYLHEKIDHLINTQIQHIHEIQQIEMDLLEDIAGKLKGVKPKKRKKKNLKNKAIV